MHFAQNRKEGTQHGRRKEEYMDYVMAISVVASISGAVFLITYVWRDKLAARLLRFWIRTDTAWFERDTHTRSKMTLLLYIEGIIP